MTPGQLARRVLGSRFEPVAKVYRDLFVDMDKVADVFAAALPPGARCLDVGSGDGFVADLLLRRRPDIRITLTDIAPAVGGFLQPPLTERVELRPSTSVSDLIGSGGRWDAVIMTDVVHHIPPAARGAVLADLAAVCREAGSRMLLIKDLAPGSPRALLAKWGDHYITGDRGVVQIGPEALKALLVTAFGPAIGFELEVPDPPNYCLLVRLPALGA